MTWTQGRRLSSITKGSQTYSYQYDMSGVRSVKIANGERHEYVTQNGSVVRDYVTNANTGAFVRCLDFFYDQSGRPLAMRKYYNSTLSGYDTFHYVLKCYKDEAQYGKNTVGYVGRTNDLDRRAKEHERDSSKVCLGKPIAVVTGLTIGEARIVEQLLISAYTLEALENHRREIGVNKLSSVNITDYIISLEMGVAESEMLCLMEQ